MKKFNQLLPFLTITIFSVLFFVNCGKKETPVIKSNEAKFASFSFKKQYNPSLSQDYTATVDEANKKITISLPAFTQVNSLIASFTVSAKASARIGTANQVSDQTANDFTSPVSYTVVAEDGSSQPYTVTASLQQSDQAFITAFSFQKSLNSGIAKDINGLITKDDKEVHLRNPYLSKSNFIANFTLSPGATLKLNGVLQTSGVTSNNFSGDLTYEVVAQNGKINTYKIKTSAHILNFDEFIKECPTNDPNINQLLSDFEIRLDGVPVSNFSCNEPYYPMTIAQYNDPIKWLQTLRYLFYLDYAQTNHLPWTNLRIYDWVKSKIGGINIVTGQNGGSCCNTFNGKPFINVGKLKDNTFGNFAQIPDLYYSWSMMNVALLLHETRHRDNFPHSNCCVAGTDRCDSKYDLTNLSPYGMHIWWFNAVLNRQFDFGFDCQPAAFIKSVIDGTWTSMDNQKNNFCNPVTIPAKPAYWNDCKYK